MASEKNEDSKFPVTGLLILVTVIGGTLFYQQPYTSDRPITENQGKAVIVGDKRVQSRLWQDPFTSVKAHKNAEKKSPGKGCVQNAFSISIHLSAGIGKETQVLPSPRVNPKHLPAARTTTILP